MLKEGGVRERAGQLGNREKHPEKSMVPGYLKVLRMFKV